MIGIENNNYTETNMLNHLPDIDTMVKTVGLPNVGIHCDYYHLHFCGDAPDPAKDWENEARENLRVLRSVFG